MRRTHVDLRDCDSPVEFSILTNSCNTSRNRMAAMIQQDLGILGINVNIVTLDFPSLIERMTRTFAYEACLLGLVNTGPGSKLANEYLAELRAEPPVESSADLSGDCLGS